MVPGGGEPRMSSHTTAPRASVVLPDGRGLWLAPETCGSLYLALTCLDDGETGRTPPPDLDQALRQVRADAKAVAIEHQKRRHRDLTSWSTPTPQVGGGRQLTAPSDTHEVTLRHAVELAGRSREWWRRLAVTGRVPGRMVAGQWWLDKRSVIDYRRRRDGGSSVGGSAGDRPGKAR